MIIIRAISVQNCDDVTIARSTFTSNVVSSMINGRGGAVYLPFTIRKCQSPSSPQWLWPSQPQPPPTRYHYDLYCDHCHLLSAPSTFMQQHNPWQKVTWKPARVLSRAVPSPKTRWCVVVVNWEIAADWPVHSSFSGPRFSCAIRFSRKTVLLNKVPTWREQQQWWRILRWVSTGARFSIRPCPLVLKVLCTWQAPVSITWRWSWWQMKIVKVIAKVTNCAGGVMNSFKKHFLHPMQIFRWLTPSSPTTLQHQVVPCSLPILIPSCTMLSLHLMLLYRIHKSGPSWWWWWW